MNTEGIFVVKIFIGQQMLLLVIFNVQNFQQIAFTNKYHQAPDSALTSTQVLKVRYEADLISEIYFQITRLFKLNLNETKTSYFSCFSFKLMLKTLRIELDYDGLKLLFTTYRQSLNFSQKISFYEKYYK